MSSLVIKRTRINLFKKFYYTREEYLKNQKEEIQRRIDLIPTHFEAWKTGRSLSKYKDVYRTYCTEMKLSDMKAQIKTIDYLLS